MLGGAAVARRPLHSSSPRWRCLRSRSRPRPSSTPWSSPRTSSRPTRRTGRSSDTRRTGAGTTRPTTSCASSCTLRRIASDLAGTARWPRITRGSAAVPPRVGGGSHRAERQTRPLTRRRAFTLRHCARARSRCRFVIGFTTCHMPALVTLGDDFRHLASPHVLELPAVEWCRDWHRPCLDPVAHLEHARGTPTSQHKEESWRGRRSW